MIELHTFQEARWFAGKGRRVAAASALAELGPLRLAEVGYADGARERYLLFDEDLRWGALLRALAQAPLESAGGRLELRAAPALQALLGADENAPERIPSTDQSNTLVCVGERLLVKAYRKLEAGIHPEVELGAALSGTSAPVPLHAGSLHHVAPDGSDTAIALLQEFVPGAVSGWEEPIEAVAAWLRAPGAALDAVVAPYAAAGSAAAALHGALAARLGAEPAPPGAGARWQAAAEAALTEAMTLDPAAAEAEDAIRRGLAPLTPATTATVSRIHGDLHFAQFLRAPDRVLVVDLEGDPTTPLARRRVPDTPLRDVAALLRSIDHIGAAAARRAPGTDPERFVAAASGAALAAYEAGTGAPVDGALLAALELAAECRELVYAHRVVPEWAYAPRAGLRRLLRDPRPEEHRPA